MQNRYYSLSTGYTTQCYWAQEVDLSEVPPDVFWNGMRGFHGAVPMSITKGGKPCDFLGNSATLRVASERVLAVLREYQLTGYGIYSVNVSGAKEELLDYYGLAAVGTGVSILVKESGLHYSSDVRSDGTRTIMSMERLAFDEDQWDGSDFFYPRELPGMILVTERVKEVFRKEKIGNCELTPTQEVSFG